MGPPASPGHLFPAPICPTHAVSPVKARAACLILNGSCPPPTPLTTPPPSEPQRPSGCGGWDTRHPASAIPLPAMLLIAVTFKKNSPDPQNVNFKVKGAELGPTVPALSLPHAFCSHCPLGPDPHHPRPAPGLGIYTMPLLVSLESLPKVQGQGPSAWRMNRSLQLRVTFWPRALAGSTRST